MKVKKIKLYSCVGMLTLSCVLLGCSSNQKVTPKEEVIEEPKEETTETTPEEEKTLVDQYMDLPIYTDQDRAAFEDIKDSFTGAFDTSSLEDMKEKWVQKIDYFKRFLQNDPTATYGGYTFSELSDTAQEKAKELFGPDFTKEFPREGTENFTYDEETDKYYATGMGLDQEEDCFLLNQIKPTDTGYEVEIVEYLEDYSQESQIIIKNLKDEEIGKVEENQESSSQDIVKNNLDKFTKKIVTLKKEGDNIYVQRVSNEV